MIIAKREASWTAPALPPSRRDGGWRFARKRKIRRISAELFCANDNLNCYNSVSAAPAMSRMPAVMKADFPRIKIYFLTMPSGRTTFP
jgi:hypothetical protein